MNYPETLDYLYGFVNKSVKKRDRYAPENINLSHIRAVLEALGNPQNSYPIIHITGTKGKGSVGAMSAAILQAAGHKVGLYSSPHLQDFRERFRINNALIAEQDVINIVETLKPIVEKIEGLTWFEVTTALAFEYFKRQNVEIAVIEVGIGGRLDATNVVTPAVSVITSLSYDHMELLGYTLTDIAREKAGIIKPGVPVVSAPQHPEALKVIEQTAREQGSKLILVGDDWRYQSLGGNLQVERFDAAPKNVPMKSYQTVLLGKHQAINGTVALAALAQLPMNIPESAIETGLMQVNWCGRLEIVKQNPLVVLDAAHNADSASWLAQTLKERFDQRPRVLVFGAKWDKDIEGMLAALLPVTDKLIVTQAIDAKAESPATIATLANISDVEVIPSVPEALQKAEQVAGMVYITGSLYLIGEARTWYGLEIGQASYLKQNI